VGSPCTHLRGATALVRIAVSPDGRNLYLSGQAGGLSILARDAAPAGCSSSPAGAAVFVATAVRAVHCSKLLPIPPADGESRRA
jgi:hypothetical protein